jgi:hypothetical protein
VSAAGLARRVENPEISGIEYQRETLVDAESWEYLVEKLGRHCAYCGDVGLTGTTSIPRVRGGSNRVSNLVPACVPCNTATRPIEKFLAHDPELCASIKAQLKAPLKDASAVTRWPLYEALADTGLPVESSSSGRTKFNRTRLGIRKDTRSMPPASERSRPSPDGTPRRLKSRVRDAGITAAPT